MKAPNALLALVLSTLLCAGAAAGVSGTPSQPGAGHGPTQRDPLPCSQCHAAADANGATLSLGLRQPRLPASARAHLRPH